MAQIFARYHPKSDLETIKNNNYFSRESVETFFCDVEYSLEKAGFDYEEIENMTEIEKYQNALDSMNIDYKQIIKENNDYFIEWNGVYCWKCDENLEFTEDSSIRTVQPDDVLIFFEGIELNCGYEETTDNIAKIINIIEIKEVV